VDWYLLPWKKVADFEGRACRREYWIFQLVNLLMGSVLGVMATGMAIFFAAAWIFVSAQLVPHFAVTVRRLHDIGRSGWWILIGLMPLIGWLILLVLCLSDSQLGTNRYGPNPKDGERTQSGCDKGFCLYCDAALPGGEAFCQKCGTRIT